MHSDYYLIISFTFLESAGFAGPFGMFLVIHDFSVDQIYYPSQTCISDSSTKDH